MRGARNDENSSREAFSHGSMCSTCLGSVPASSGSLLEALWTLPRRSWRQSWTVQDVPRALLGRPGRVPERSWTHPPVSLHRPRALRTPQDRSKIDFGMIFVRCSVDFHPSCQYFGFSLTRIASDLAIDGGTNSASQKRPHGPLRASARVRWVIVSCYARGFRRLFVPLVCDANIQVHLVVK